MGTAPRKKTTAAGRKSKTSGARKLNGTKADRVAAKAKSAGGKSIRTSAGSKKNYVPNESEPFMNKRQREYFRAKLLRWKEEILRETRETLEHLQTGTAYMPDLGDRATAEAQRSLELRARDRQRKLVSKINAALRRIDDGSYGYCEETGEPISLKRLHARPIATLSIEAQERHEMRERVYSDN